MRKTATETLDNFEQYLLGQQAELVALRLLLDYVEEMLADVKNSALANAEKMRFDDTPPAQAGLARTKITERLEAVFRDSELALSEARRAAEKRPGREH